jgi:hypothetical protein
MEVDEIATIKDVDAVMAEAEAILEEMITDLEAVTNTENQNGLCLTRNQAWKKSTAGSVRRKHGQSKNYPITEYHG